MRCPNCDNPVMAEIPVENSAGVEVGVEYFCVECEWSEPAR